MENLADDLMVGIKPIAKFLGVPERAAFYMAEKRMIPVFKIGSKWAARRSTITTDIIEREKSAA
jgi:hypothetical protein